MPPLVDENVIAFMVANPVVQTLAFARVYYLSPPANAPVPYITLQSSGDRTDREVHGMKDKSVRVRMNVITVEASDGRVIAESIVDVLNGYRGDVGELSDCSISCEGVFPVVGTLRNQHSFDATIKYVEVDT